LVKSSLIYLKKKLYLFKQCNKKRPQVLDLKA
jgi:hypothetical protein